MTGFDDRAPADSVVEFSAPKRLKANSPEFAALTRKAKVV